MKMVVNYFQIFFIVSLFLFSACKSPSASKVLLTIKFLKLVENGHIQQLIMTN